MATIDIEVLEEVAVVTCRAPRPEGLRLEKQLVDERNRSPETLARHARFTRPR
jgi:hypothetical protein